MEVLEIGQSLRFLFSLAPLFVPRPHLSGRMPGWKDQRGYFHTLIELQYMLNIAEAGNQSPGTSYLPGSFVIIFTTCCQSKIRMENNVPGLLDAVKHPFESTLLLHISP